MARSGGFVLPGSRLPLSATERVHWDLHTCEWVLIGSMRRIWCEEIN